MTGPVAPTARAAITLLPLGIAAVDIGGGYWSQRQRVNREVSIPLALTRIDEAGNLDNLRMAAEQRSGTYRGPVFMDSDVYKVLEAVAWEQGRRPSPELAAAAQSISAAIRDAQSADGYLNSYVQVTRGGKDRYADLAMGHELYCFGHLLQAAVAAHRVAPNEHLWPAALRVADHLRATFGPDGAWPEAVEGHPLIEMALVERDPGRGRGPGQSRGTVLWVDVQQARMDQTADHSYWYCVVLGLKLFRTLPLSP